MGKQFSKIEPDHQTFIEQQKMFFVASAAAQGRVNVSPKGMASLVVLGAMMSPIWIRPAVAAKRGRICWHLTTSA